MVKSSIRGAFTTLVAIVLFGLSAGASSASTYYVRVTGTPSAIACDGVSYNVGPGATLVWDLVSASSIVDTTLFINGVQQGASTFSPAQLAQGASGSHALTGGNSVPYPTTPFPYTVSYVLQPEDWFTDGVSVSFTCNSTGGTGFSTSALPPIGPILTASPSSLSFSNLAVGATSAPRAVTIANTGTVDATGVTLANGNSADFTVTGNTCGATLPQGAMCGFNVSFKPSAAGVRTGQLTLSGAGGVSTSITMTGTGTTALTIASSVVFGNQSIGTTSAPGNVTVTNASAATVNVASVISSNAAEFPVTSTCGAVTAGAACNIALSFAPNGSGARSSTVTVTSNGAGSPQTISVTGTGTAAANPGQLSVPGTVTFGVQTVGTASAPSSVTLTNSGGGAVTVGSIVSSAPAEFAVASPGCTTINPGANCTVNVTFTPAAAGARAATIIVTSNGLGSPQAIAASGTGTTPVAPGQLQMPGPVNFGTQSVGTPSAGIPVTLTNVGGTAVTVSSISSSAPSEFAMTSPSCQTINAGGNCVIVVVFTPAAAGARAATITVTSNGVGSPQSFSLSGIGISSSSPGQLSIPATLTFGNIPIGTITAPGAVTATNAGDSAVQVTSIGSGNPSEFTVTQSNCATVNPGASCSFSVTFTPSAAGARTATITVVSSGIGSPQAVAANGTGVATVDVIEYYHAEWDHYFMTSIADEITKLDNGVFVGWARTGYKFKSYPLDTVGSADVCRFFSTSFAPKSSHFYTPFPDECAKVQTNPDWQLEGLVFDIPVPEINGACPVGTVPVYRLYNNGQGGAPNHRYTIDFGVRAQMIASGWLPEGYGDLGVIMCAPN